MLYSKLNNNILADDTTLGALPMVGVMIFNFFISSISTRRYFPLVVRIISNIDVISINMMSAIL